MQGATQTQDNYNALDQDLLQEEQTLYQQQTTTDIIAILTEQTKNQLRSEWQKLYAQHCLQNLTETFTLRYTPDEYHYTLYYYDQAGSLVQTVPPAGVQPLTDAQAQNYAQNPVEPQHLLKTRYAYNTLGQPTQQETPDAGKTTFLYDQNGQLRLSQNAQQKLEDKYAFTRYDQQSRIVEVGVLHTQLTQNQLLTAVENPAFPTNAQNKTELTQTLYDYPTAQTEGLPQTFLRGRVSSVSVKEDGQTVSSRSTYSYDVHGNVKTLWQKVPELQEEEQIVRGSFPNWQVQTLQVEAQKRVDYEYDLIAGKVNKVKYQDGKADAFYHRYRYDADNRLISVKTSVDNWLWNEEALYRYYAHGSLARVELGEYKVQGLDYFYTLQGWLKGVNNPLGDDIGRDAVANTQYKHVNADAFAFSLDYFQGDYKAINSTQTFATTGYTSLYNGNIAAMTTDLKGTLGLQTRQYRYDQLNRIKSAQTLGAAQKFRETFAFDGNGNILNCTLNDANGTEVDNATYHYFANSNKLSYIADQYGEIFAGFDLPNQSAGNYQYDAIGNQIQDLHRNLNQISWTSYNKPREAIKNNGKKVVYHYDGLNNKVKQTYEDPNSHVRHTYYVRDAVGNVLAVYEKTDTFQLSDPDNADSQLVRVEGETILKEHNLYGSSRLGVVLGQQTKKVRLLGRKNYELSNHLGNVLAVITDNKRKVGASYETNVISETHYLAYGLASESYHNPQAQKYRFSFNGKEDDDILGWQDYGFRHFDKLTRRFTSVDPLTHEYPWYTPYQFAGNKVIQAIDLDGLEEHIINENDRNDMLLELTLAIGATVQDSWYSARNVVNMGLGLPFRYRIQNGKYQLVQVKSSTFSEFAENTLNDGFDLMSVFGFKAGKGLSSPTTLFAKTQSKGTVAGQGGKQLLQAVKTQNIVNKVKEGEELMTVYRSVDLVELGSIKKISGFAPNPSLFPKQFDLNYEDAIKRMKETPVHGNNTQVLLEVKISKPEFEKMRNSVQLQQLDGQDALSVPVGAIPDFNNTVRKVDIINPN
ncbi:RHS repeat domain-containing protein [Hugenholtzia roseola]|uniref:RHS repeat domain-containing protein n=1 Tax=Hugenholtzia roseola TaxID=1002 RepID=UPI000406150A|nr:RHS repeat-associated core domain-containing protein [Hugenholtzia roseola]